MLLNQLNELIECSNEVSSFITDYYKITKEEEQLIEEVVKSDPQSKQKIGGKLITKNKTPKNKI